MRTALELSTPVCASGGCMLWNAVATLNMTLNLNVGLAAACTFVLALAANRAWADDSASVALTESIVAPPPSERAYIQYGAALSAEIVAFPGPACADTTNPCILGSGGGIVARGGWRPTETLYVGGAYEMSKQEPHQLYRLAILQQLRGEVRRYFPTGREASPFLLAAAGIGAYGNYWWPVDTWGPSATLGGGIEIQLGGAGVFIISVAYRPMYLDSWRDSSRLWHEAGVAHFMGLEAAIEALDSL
ncbi:MAG: hypothetical protein M3O46_05015 [Myxococcota bacterium]|nr:hypothetical protein [Myxococcota bacterium]